MTRSRCMRCREEFVSMTTFDKHRTGTYWPVENRRCLSVEEMREKGLVKNKKGLWTVPMPAEIINRMQAKQVDSPECPKTA